MFPLTKRAGRQLIKQQRRRITELETQVGDLAAQLAQPGKGGHKPMDKWLLTLFPGPKSMEEGICPPTQQANSVQPAKEALYPRIVAM